MCVDLHTHSIYSDGTASPAELVDLALARGITALALTDHDTMAGIAEICSYGSDQGLTILSGVEISARHGAQSMHILGYGIDPADSLFHDWLQQLQAGREERNLKIIQTLQAGGIEISLEEVAAEAGIGLTGRPHIANLLIQKGVVRSFNEAFKQYLGRGRAAWHSRFCYSVIDTIAAIHRAGGAAILAHPGQLDPTMRLHHGLLRELASHGLDGIEIHYPSHTRKMKKKLTALAETFQLLSTGGSDYHGATRPANVMAGGTGSLRPPAALLAPLQARIAHYQN
ncbi:PHP domain-containing protein [Desulfogranum mediterraneum]|uniref:PHP domain-containing protein n=1 Tax=Desulfogranum mediterraneum TaxID=160661 RepID=UPI0004062525|nr:PHP domain-containing protein [Desulfogranum mediterraneum]